MPAVRQIKSVLIFSMDEPAFMPDLKQKGSNRKRTFGVNVKFSLRRRAKRTFKNDLQRRAAMEIIVEKRVYDRHPYDGPITFSFYNNSKFYEAKVINYSKGGMCFKSEFAPKKGATVYIRMLNYPGDDLDPEALEGLRTVALAEVKWAGEKENDDPLFSIGVRYFVPEY